jgi:hypothetical protein
MKSKVLVILFLFSFSISSKAINVSNVDFVYFLQNEIGNCVLNLKAITGDKKKHNIFLNECTRIIVSANRLGKVEFLYKESNSNELKRSVEECSEYLIPKDFLNCVYD